MKITMEKHKEEDAFIMVIGNDVRFIEMTLPIDGDDQRDFLTSLFNDIQEGRINEETVRGSIEAEVRQETRQEETN